MPGHGQYRCSAHTAQCARCVPAACAPYFFFTCFMYRTPQALQSVLGPYGPARQTGVTCSRWEHAIRSMQEMPRPGRHQRRVQSAILYYLRDTLGPIYHCLCMPCKSQPQTGTPVKVLPSEQALLQV